MTVITFEFIIPAITFLLAAWAFTTQILIPSVRGTRLFPAFSKQYLDLVDEMTKVDEEIEAEHLRHELANKQAALQKEKEAHGH